MHAIAIVSALCLFAVPVQDKKLDVGQDAPAFRLNDHEGKLQKVGGASKSDWTILVFYPMALTPG